ncbi:MAG: thiamine ABC transporter substrate-binding protein [Treponema sp.]|nr:MAG: thiamine ABC transporter substrate-binding protein [Treponema sp.]
MKTRFFSFFMIVFFAIFCSSFAFAFGGADENVVVVYAYDSFVAEWGPGPEIIKRFEEATGYKVEFFICEDAGTVLSKAILEKNSPQADVLVGIDNFLIQKARRADVLTPYIPKNKNNITSADLVFAKDYLLTPYDYGYFAFMYDTNSKIPAPKSLKDLLKPEYKKSIVLMDPRISTPGLGFLMWTKAVFGKDYLNYWKKLDNSVLTITPGWSSGYNLFTAGEAPLVSSYTTSMAYHVKYDKTERYQALIFPEGHIRQIEGLGLVKNARNPKGAKAFIEFMLTKEVQQLLTETQWMYPVALKGNLPASFNKVKVPGKVLKINDNPEEVLAESVKFLLK